MSSGKRSLGVSFFASTFTWGSFFSILFWASPLYICVTQPDQFSAAGKYLLKNPLPGTAYLLYENTLLFAYFFIGIGLWRLKPWAYRLLMVLLLVESIEKLWLGIKAGLGQNLLAAGSAAGQFMGSIFLLLFFRRKKISAQFEDEAGEQIPAQTFKPMLTAAPALGGDFAASDIIRESRHEAGEASKELERLAGSEKVISWVVMLAGIIFSLKQKMSVVKGGLFGGLWGVESYVLCFYFFRARKLAALAGGGISVAISLALTALVHLPAESGWMGYALNVIPNLFGGFVSGFMTRHNRWFHGSSAGFVWAVFYFIRDFYEKHGWTPSFEKLDLLQLLNASLIVMVIGLLSGCLGGLLSALRLGKNR